MNPFNYGAASMAHMESEGAENMKRKKKRAVLFLLELMPVFRR
jgi:hypothetical protein